MSPVDAHHHFWRYSAAEYPWISDRMSLLRRDFGIDHLRQAMHEAGIAAAVSVQARQSIDETDSLLAIAATASEIAGVVGWVPLADPHVEQHLERFATDHKCKGFRHVLQDEPDDALMDDAAFNRGVAALARFGFRYDILIYERHLAAAIAFADRHPNLTFILDHVAKPSIAAGTLQPWATLLADLARRQNVFCKISGMVTEAHWDNWSPATLAPYFEVALETFGPRRLMFGSDWPVALLATGYTRWVQTVRHWTATLTPAEQARIWGETAVQAYGLTLPPVVE